MKFFRSVTHPTKTKIRTLIFQPNKFFRKNCLFLPSTVSSGKGLHKVLQLESFDGSWITSSFSSYTFAAVSNKSRSEETVASAATRLPQARSKLYQYRQNSDVRKQICHGFVTRKLRFVENAWKSRRAWQHMSKKSWNRGHWQRQECPSATDFGFQNLHKSSPRFNVDMFAYLLIRAH